MDIEEIRECVTLAAQLASILEVSGYPKPGNVHRTADFPDTRYEHFLAGGIAMGPAISKAAMRGALVAEGKIEPADIGIGECIRRAISEVRKSHKGGNTHLGMILLFIPLAAAAGKTYAEDRKIEPERLRKNVELVMRSTTPADSAQTYDAIVEAVQMGKARRGTKKGGESWFGSIETAPDLSNKKVRKRLLMEGVSLYDWMGASSGWDSIARELTTGMRVSFEIGYPALRRVLREHRDINVAIVHTFLKILSEFPDTLVARKVGLKSTSDVAEAVRVGRRETIWISNSAKSILEAGGLTTDRGRKMLCELDETLQKACGELNPGTTADLTAASLAVGILCGLKF